MICRPAENGREETLRACGFETGGLKKRRKISYFAAGRKCLAALHVSIELTAFDGLSAAGEQGSRVDLPVRQAVPVEIQRCFGRLMAEKRADRLNVDAQLQQPRGETVPKRMKMNVGKPERLYLPLEAALKGAGIRRASGPAEQIRFGTVCGKKGFSQKRKQKFRNRQNPMRTPGFGRADCKPRARARAACAPRRSLYRSPDGDRPLFPVDIRPFQRAHLAQPHAGIEAD